MDLLSFNDVKNPIFHQMASYMEDVLHIAPSEFNKLTPLDRFQLAGNQVHLILKHKHCEFKPQIFPTTIIKDIPTKLQSWPDIIEIVKWIYKNQEFMYPLLNSYNKNSNLFFFYLWYGSLLTEAIRNEFKLIKQLTKCIRHNLPMKITSTDNDDENDEIPKMACIYCGSIGISFSGQCLKCNKKHVSDDNIIHRTDICVLIENQNQKAIPIVSECCFDNRLSYLSIIIIEYANEFMGTYDFDQFIYSQKGKDEFKLIQDHLNKPHKCNRCRNSSYQSVISCFSNINDGLIGFVRVAEKPIDNSQFTHLVSKIQEKHLPIPYSVPTFTQLDPSECCRFVELILNLKQLGLFVIRLSNDDIYYKLFHENKRQRTKKIVNC